VDEAVAVASRLEYQKLTPRYISEIKKMVAGVNAIEAAFAGMQAIRNEMIAGGFRDIFPSVSWPGITPSDFQQARENFKFYCRQQGLSEALIK
jgi:hypothetical protein